MARRRSSGLRGATRLRRVLRRIDPEATTELRTAIDEGAEAVLYDMIALTPRRTGDLARLLSYRVSRDGMQARVGLITKAAQRDGFYFRFLDVGTKGYPARNIPPQPALHIRSQAMDLNRAWIIKRVEDGTSLALRRASKAGGSMDD